MMADGDAAPWLRLSPDPFPGSPCLPHDNRRDVLRALPGDDRRKTGSMKFGRHQIARRPRARALGPGLHRTRQVKPVSAKIGTWSAIPAMAGENTHCARESDSSSSATTLSSMSGHSIRLVTRDGDKQMPCQDRGPERSHRNRSCDPVSRGMGHPVPHTPPYSKRTDRHRRG